MLLPLPCLMTSPLHECSRSDIPRRVVVKHDDHHGITTGEPRGRWRPQRPHPHEPFLWDWRTDCVGHLWQLRHPGQCQSSRQEGAPLRAGDRVVVVLCRDFVYGAWLVQGPEGPRGQDREFVFVAWTFLGKLYMLIVCFSQWIDSVLFGSLKKETGLRSAHLCMPQAQQKRKRRI